MMMQDNKSEVNTPPLVTDGIHTCAESGNLTAFQRLLHQNPYLLNEKSILMTQTPLHIAAGLNRVEIVKYLLQWRGPGNVELEAKNVYGETPLHAAAKNGCNESVRMLLDCRANVEAKTNDSMTPLHLAVGFALQSGDNSTINILSEYNADSSVKDDEGMTSLNYLPAGTQNEELVKPLYGNVASQMNIFTQQEGMTSLNYLPTGIQNDELVKLLYGNDASQMNIFTQQEGMTSLNYLPTGTQNDELVKLLYGNDASQMNTFTQQVNSFTQQIYNPTGYNLNGLLPTNYSSTNNDCSSSAGNQNVDSGENGKMKEFDEELSKIVGLQSLKQQLRKWAKGILLDEKRRAMGLNLGSRKSPHMAFLGNPGTGKTSVARILGRLMHSVGVLSTDKVTEVQRTDLIAEYLGQTGPKTRKKIEEAMGGILFIDEAYRLAPKQSAGSHVDFGVEALEEIMSFLEDGNLVVVFAGYTDKMKAVFSTNEGFCRRVNHFFEFDDYSSRDLAEMLMIKMSKQDEKSRLCGFKLHPSCTFEAVLALIERGSTKKLRGKMNGGLVDNMLNNARECLDLRLTFNSSGDELLTITLGDLENGLKQIAKRENVC